MTTTCHLPGWAALEQALRERRPIRIRYHGHERVVCPHALGWKHGRPKVLAYQTGGTTSQGPLPPDPEKRWRSMFVDEIEDVLITDGAWESAANYSQDSTCFGDLEIAV